MKYRPEFEAPRRSVSWLGLLQVIALLTFAFSIISLSGIDYWALELTSHFRLPYLYSALICFLLFVLLRHYFSALIMFLVVVLNVSVVWPLFSIVDVASADEGAATIKIFHANIYSQNQDASLLLSVMDVEKPDIVVLLEVTPRWEKKLAPLLNQFPYKKLVVREGNFGIALLSKFKLSDIEVITTGNTAVPSIQAVIELQNQQVNLLATHPLPPVTPDLKQQRDKQLKGIAGLVLQGEKPVVVVGDLNITHWSPVYHEFIKQSGLVNARQGRGVLPTWPSRLSFIGLPIDHVLYAGDIAVKSIYTCDDIGSDHLPLVAELQFNRTSE